MPALLDRESREVSGHAKRPYNRLQKDLAWLSRNRDVLAKRYRDEYVAVSRVKLVAHAKNIKTLISRLRAEGYTPDQVIVDFLTDENRTLIL